ncbi:MAG: O-antigen ligase family protein [Chloroflexota bacterium]
MNSRDNLPDLVCRCLSAGEWIILLLASPLFLFPQIELAPVLLLFPLLWLARRRTQGHYIPRTPVDWPILGLLGATLVSLWVTPDLVLSYRKIAGLLYGMALFYALVNWARRQPTLLLPTLLALVLGFGAALLGLLGTNWTAKFPIVQALSAHVPQLISGVTDAESGFNPNHVAGALIMYLPLQAALLSELAWQGITSPARRRGLIWGLALLLTFTAAVVLLTQSRVAWAALALGLAGLGAIRLPRWRPFLLAGIVLIATLVLAVGPVGLGDWLVAQGFMNTSGETSWEARVELWSRALWAITDFPLTGVGMNAFRQVVWYLYPLFQFPAGKDIGHAHNAYLQTALDLGLPGLICYLALLGGTLAAGWRTYRRSRCPLTRLAALGGTVGLIVNGLWGLTDAIALGAKHGFLWWAMLALVIAAALRYESEASEEKPA